MFHKKRKKGILFMPLTILVIYMLSGCGTTPLSSEFNEDEVITTAKCAVEVITSGDYEMFTQLCSDEMQTAIEGTVMQDAIAQVMPDPGAFVKYKEVTTVGVQEDDGTKYASVIIKAVYKNQSVTFTVGIDKKMKIVGFYMN